MRSVIDDRLGKTIYADNIKIVKGKTRQTPKESLNKAGLQILAVDRSELFSKLRMMGSDNIITPVEKRTLGREWKSLKASLSTSMQKVREYDIAEHTVTTTLLQSFDDLENFLDIVLDPTKMEENTDITELGDISALFETYYSNKTALDEMLFRLETGMLNGLDYRTKFVVNVTSSTGITIPIDGSPSILRASLYQEGVEVTDDYPDTDFSWSRLSEDREADGTWKETEPLVGKSITITKDDLVYKSASFICTFRHVYSDTMYFEKMGFATLSEEVPGKDGEDAISVQIFSSNGSVFRSGQCFTTMTATVWRGDEDITDTLDASYFTWERTSGDSVADESWNTSSKAIGQKSIELTPQDVVGRAVFACHVEL